MQEISLFYHFSKNNTIREHVSVGIVYLPDTLSNKERCGDTSCSLYCPAVGQSDAEGCFCGFGSDLIASFFPDGLKDSQLLR